MAGLGAAIGCGLWQMGVIGTLLILLTLSGVKRVSKTVNVRVLKRDRRHINKIQSDKVIAEKQDIV